MSRHPSLLIVIADMGSGGAQQVVSNLANYWAGKGMRIGVVTWAESETDFFQLDPRIERFVLGGAPSAQKLGQGLANNIGRIRALRKLIRGFGAQSVLSFIAPTNVLAVIASAGLDTRLVISERNDPARQSFGHIWDGLRRLLYARAEMVSANSFGAVETMKRFVPAERLCHLPNPIRQPVDAKASRARREKLVVSVGRLHSQKAFDVLIEAFALIADDLPEWRLVIVGEGAERQRLERLIESRKLGGRVELAGEAADPFHWYARAGIFALPSRYEGSPNALLEAMSCAAPCIISDAIPDHGLLADGGNAGRVVKAESAENLSTAIRDLAADEDLRKRLGAAGAKHTQSQKIENVAPLWEEVVWGRA